MTDRIEVDENTLLPKQDVQVRPHLQMEFNVDFFKDLEICLKPKKEKFAQLIVQGKSATEAYEIISKDEGKSITRKSCTEKGCKYLADPDIQKRIRQLYKAVIDQFVMSDIEIHKHLSDIVRSSFHETKDRIAALKLIAQIKGLAKGDTQVQTEQHFVNLQVEVVDSKSSDNNLQVIEASNA